MLETESKQNATVNKKATVRNRNAVKRQRRIRGLMCGVLALAIGLAFTLPSSSEARGSAKIYIFQGKVPKKLSERGLIGFARKHRKKKLQEIKDKPLKERYWLAKMVAAFKRPPGDVEFQVLFYDITGGARDFISPALSIFINDRKQRTFLQKLKLERPTFKPNRKLEAVVTVRRTEMGRTKLELQGEVKRNSGKVDFSDDET